MITPFTPPIERQPFNVDGKDTSANQVGVPVTYAGGPAKITMDPITPLYNLHSKDVKSSGKGSKGGSSGQKNWYADVVYLICVVPSDPDDPGAIALDSVGGLIINHAVAWSSFGSPVTRGASDYYAPITIPKYCTSSRLYWGRADQPIDDLVLAPRGARLTTPGFNPRDPSTWPADNGPGVVNPVGGHYDQHPAYRNFAIWVFKELLLGSSPTFPNMECLCNRAVRYFDTTYGPDGQGSNPIAQCYELGSNDFFGAGIAEDELDRASWDAAAAAADDQRFAIVLTSTQSVRSLFAQLVKYYDGWFCRRGDLLRAGFFAHGDVDTSGLKVFGNDELTEEPSIKPGNLDETLNSFLLQFSDQDHFFNDNTVPYEDGANIGRVGEVRPDPEAQPLQMPGIISADRALQFISDYGRGRATIGAGGSIVAKVEEVDGTADANDGIEAGDLCKLDSASLGLEYVLRIMGVTWPDDRGGTAKIEVTQETGHWPEKYVQLPAPKDPDFVIEAFEIQNQRIIELPGALKAEDNYYATQIAVLAERPFVHIIGFNVHLSVDGGTYNLLGTGNFAAYGEVETAYPAATNILDIGTGVRIELFGPDLEKVVSQTDQARDDNTLLLFIDSEIMSVGVVSALGDGVFKLYVRRGLYGTPLQSHSASAPCWIVLRSELKRFTHAAFAAGATRYFKLTSFIVGEEFPVGDAEAIAHTFAQFIPYHLTGLEIEGQGNNTTYTGRDPVFVAYTTVEFTAPILDADPLANYSLGQADQTFLDYRYRVRDSATGETVIPETVFPGFPFTFAYERNAAAPDGPRRSYDIDFTGSYRARDGAIALAPWVSIRPNNPAPPALDPSFFLDGNSVVGTWTAPVDLDFTRPRYRVHRGLTSDFNPTNDNLVYDGPDNRVVLDQASGTTTWYRVAAVDAFGPDQLNYSVAKQVIRELEYIEDLGLPSVSPGSTNYDTSLDVHAMAGTGETLRYTQDNSPVGPGSAVWPGTQTITGNATYRFRAYRDNHRSPELSMTYLRSDAPVAPGGGAGTGATCGNVSIARINGAVGRSAVIVRITCATPGAVITTDTSGTILSGGTVVVDLDSSVTAYASAAGYADGPESTFDNASSGPPL